MGLSFLLATLLSSSAMDVACTRPSHLFDVGEKAVFEVGSAHSGVPVTIHVVSGHELRPTLPPPADFDSFWENAFRELEGIPADFVRRPIENGLWEVSCATVNGKRQYGYSGST